MGDTPMETPRRTLALIFPVYNEVEVLPALLDAVSSFRAERPFVRQVIFVDDGSTDDSVALIKGRVNEDEGVEVISLSRNFGHQLAITAGIAGVRTDAAVILDADLQDPLYVVDEMIARWREGRDVVYGIRVKRKGEPFYKRMAAAAFYRFFRWMADVEMPLDTGDFRLISRPVIDAFNAIDDPQPFVRGIIAWLGYEQVGVPYVREPRAAGTSKYTLGKLIGLALSGLTSFSEKPLRLATRFGLFTAVLSLAGLAGYLTTALLTSTEISANTALVFMGFFFGGVQLLFLGIIGIYLIRVYGEVKSRPRYVIASKWHSGE